MIIVASPNDQTIINIAQNQSANNVNTYGNTYVMGNSIPQLGPNENLFIIGHATPRGDSNLPELGDANGAFAVDGQELYGNLEPIFPAGYAADVYIDACSSANWGRGGFSFIELFKSQIAPVFNGVRVFGRLGEVSGNIPDPNDNSVWRQA